MFLPDKTKIRIQNAEIFKKLLNVKCRNYNLDLSFEVDGNGYLYAIGTDVNCIEELKSMTLTELKGEKDAKETKDL